MRYYLFFALLFLGFCRVIAQNDIKSDSKSNHKEKNQQERVYKKKNILKDVKSLYKAKNYNKTNETILNAFNKYPEANNDPDLLGYEMNTQFQLYLAENRKIYLNNNGDTVRLLSFIYNTYLYGLKCDSVCKFPDKKGRIINRYNSDVNNHLSYLRNNLKSGGLYYLKKQKYADALPFFTIYLNSIDKPFVYKTKDNSVPVDTDSVRIYKMALHAAYGAEKYNEVMRFLPVAISDTIRKDKMMEMGAESALQLRDSITFIQLLKEGFELYPTNDFFRANLIKLYHDHNDFENTMRVLDKCIETDSLDARFWKLKGNEFYDLDSIDAAILPFCKVINIDDNDAETLSKLGNIYIRKARDFYINANLKFGAPDFSKNRRHLTDLYTKAMDYYERVRKICPEKPEIWKTGLREAYYKLNKGKELEQLERTR